MSTPGWSEFLWLVVGAVVGVVSSITTSLGLEEFRRWRRRKVLIERAKLEITMILENTAKMATRCFIPGAKGERYEEVGRIGSSEKTTIALETIANDPTEWRKGYWDIVKLQSHRESYRQLWDRIHDKAEELRGARHRKDGTEIMMCLKEFQVLMQVGWVISHKIDSTGRTVLTDFGATCATPQIEEPPEKRRHPQETDPEEGKGLPIP